MQLACLGNDRKEGGKQKLLTTTTLLYYYTILLLLPTRVNIFLCITLTHNSVPDFASFDQSSFLCLMSKKPRLCSPEKYQTKMARMSKIGFLAFSVPCFLVFSHFVFEFLWRFWVVYSID
jgi:hypothetical protein